MTLEPTIPPEIETLRRYRASCVDFGREAAFTIDQTDKANPVKPFPMDKPYLPWVITQMVEEALFALVKHRRMVCTWSMCLVFLWDAMFYEGRFNALISKKEEDSDDLVRRCKFIYDNLPKGIIKPKAVYKYTELSFPEIDSKIKGFAQGPDQLRQYTCSRIGGDEIAFWPQARATFVAMKPTLEGGGKVTLISTRYPGFFKELIEDTLDQAA